MMRTYKCGKCGVLHKQDDGVPEGGVYLDYLGIEDCPKCATAPVAVGDVAGGERDCDGCTRWGARYHKLQQDLQQKLIELNDKRIAAETRASELETKLRCAKGEHCMATSGGGLQCVNCGVLG